MISDTLNTVSYSLTETRNAGVHDMLMNVHKSKFNFFFFITSKHQPVGQCNQHACCCCQLGKGSIDSSKNFQVFGRQGTRKVCRRNIRRTYQQVKQQTTRAPKIIYRKSLFLLLQSSMTESRDQRKYSDLIIGYFRLDSSQSFVRNANFNCSWTERFIENAYQLVKQSV